MRTPKAQLNTSIESPEDDPPPTGERKTVSQTRQTLVMSVEEVERRARKGLDDAAWRMSAPLALGDLALKPHGPIEYPRMDGAI